MHPQPPGRPEPARGTTTAAPRDPGALAWAVHRLAVAITEADVALGRLLGLGARDYLAVKHLLLAEEPLGPVELGRVLGISSGSATTLVDRLENAGHVRRHAHAHDQRRRTVTVAPSTRATVLAELASLGTALDAVADGLTEAERRAVEHVLDAAARAARPRVSSSADPTGSAGGTGPASPGGPPPG